MAAETDNSPDPGDTNDPHHASQHSAERSKDQKRKSRNGLLRAAVIIAIVFAILLVVGVIPRMINHPKLEAAAKTERHTAPTVTVVQPQPSPATNTLNLPGTVDAIQQSSIYARSSGYLQRWLVDIGDRVQVGQLVAVIESPEVDQQLNQARAQYSQAEATVAQSRASLTSTQGDLAQQDANLSHAQAQYAQAGETLAQNKAQLAQAVQAADQQKAQLTLAQANLDLARVTAQRYQNLAKQGAIDQQTADQTQASYLTNRATVESMQAAVAASQSNVDAYKAGVNAGEANLKAFNDSVTAAQAAVRTAAANVDSARATISAAQANADSNAANVAHAAVLTSYERVTAPFSGVITARNVDTGDLINGGSSVSSTVGSSEAGVVSSGSAASGGGLGGSVSASPSGSSSSGTGSLFSIAQLDTLRVYINVPQTYATGIRPEQPAQVTFHEYPNRVFTGVITRTAAALDPATRTLVSEVDLSNPGDLLRPGMFAQVQIKVTQAVPSLLVPDSAIVNDASGLHVMTVTSNGKVHMQPIAVGRDYGSVIEILSGLQPTDSVISDPNNNLQEGTKVNAEPQPAGAAPTTGIPTGYVAAPPAGAAPTASPGTAGSTATGSANGAR